AFASQSVMPALTRTVPRSAAVGQAAVPWGWPVWMGDLFKSRVGGRGALQIVDDGKMRGRVRYRVGLEKRRVLSPTASLPFTTSTIWNRVALAKGTASTARSAISRRWP